MHGKLLGALSLGILIGVILGIIASRTARAPGDAGELVPLTTGAQQGSLAAPAPTTAQPAGSVALDSPPLLEGRQGGGSAEAELVEIVHRINRAVEQGRLEVLREYGSPGMEGFLGRRVTAEQFAAEFDRRYLPPGRVKIAEVDVQARVVGDVGWTKAEEVWTIEPASANPQQVRMLTTIIFQRMGGRWRMVHVHQSPFQTVE
jgi:ketosteroid isomerase-like protein